MPTFLHQVSTKEKNATTSRLHISVSTKSFLSMNTDQDFRLPKIKSHINANPKFIKTNFLFKPSTNYPLPALNPLSDKIPTLFTRQDGQQQGCS